ncbi:hypothetical protein L6164_031561 [Bauhinia variegata]|uniref:Uncharacterized protein n=1 Tax=Bauhinia variegata TaxID=167791 RepID=A0ACB9LHD4_BAUVA|nr:hypothetical protein L6164_031561 [Bauhinia variegata]
MALWLILLLPLLTVGESQPTNAINQTDLQVAMADMRMQSYHGFVILLKILNSIPNSLQTTDLTFLMPNDDQLSHFLTTRESLHEFILSRSIPTALVLNHLLHFPSGTLVPSSIPSKMISITNSGIARLYVNNARIITPNVCLSSLIRCHGISATLKFDKMVPSLRAPDYEDHQKNNGAPKLFLGVSKIQLTDRKQIGLIGRLVLV